MENARVCLETAPLVIDGQATGHSICTAWASLSSAAFASLEELGITSESMFQVFGWGIGVVLLFWGLGFGIAAVRDVLNRV